MSNSRIKIGYISVHPAPYRDPVLCKVNQKEDVDLDVLSLFDIDIGHDYWRLSKADYREIILPQKKLFGRIYHPDLNRTISRNRYDVVVIPGFLNLSCWLAWAHCTVHGTTAILFADTIETNINKKYSVREFVRKVRDKTISHNRCVFVPGNASNYYWRKSGVPEDKIFWGAYSLDTEVVDKEVQLHRARRSEIRKEFNIPCKAVVLLMVANFLETRKYPDFVTALELLCNHTDDSFVVLLGTGEQWQLTKDRVRERGIEERVMMPGPVPFSDLAKWYAISDIYTHYGSEPYSTAIAYGAISGLALISSSNVGASKDYVIQGRTGYEVDMTPEAFAGAMIELVSETGLRTEMGERVRQLAICELSVENAASQLVKAARKSVCK